MHWQISPHSYLIGAATIVSALSVYRGWQRRRAKGANAFTLLMVGVTIWSLGYAFEISAADLAIKLIWAQVQYLGIVLVPTAWIIFASQYSGRDEWITPRTLALLTIEPVIILTLVLTNNFHKLIWVSLQLDTSGNYVLLDYTYGWGFWLNAIYSYVLLVIATTLLTRSFMHSSSLYRRQTGIILIGALAPWLGNVVYLLGLSPVPNLDLTPIAFTFTGICVGWGLFRYKLLDLVPVAHKAIVENMNAGVIVLDSQNRIIDINPFAARTFSKPPETLFGQDIFRILTDLPDSVEPYKHVTSAHTEIPITNGETTEYFQLNISPLEDHRGGLIGRLIVFHNITELKRSEKALQESESHFRSLFELTPDAQLLLDTSELPKIVDTNPAASELYRYKREQLIGMPISRLLLPEDIGKISDWRAKLLKDIKVCYEGVHLTQDSDQLSVELQASLIEIKGELFILTTHHDITDRLKTEETLRRRAEELILLNDTFQDITTTNNLTDLFETIVERAVRLFKAESGGLYLCDPERKETRCVVSYNTPNDYRGIVLQYGEGAAGMVAQSGEALIIDDYRKWSKRADVYEEEQPFRSMISAPLRWQDQVRGVIHILHDSNNHRFTQNDLELLTLFANQATISIENTRFLETERQRSQDLEILRQASLELTSSLEPQSVFESILAYALKLVSADDAHIFIYNEGKLTFGAALWSGGRREEPFAEPRKDGITYKVARS
ncbi:MAG: histidine kinase N-terminal 7TM domain-containing protein, partial [Anaerolineales bacterium]